MRLTEPVEVAETCLAGNFWILPASEANDAQFKARTENILGRVDLVLNK